jgi:pimeloyl-ACP methyl ester carboxylesterase
MHQIIYLHGFASGPSSTKAIFFASKLRALGFTVHVPDLNGNSFTDMTLSSQLELCRTLMSMHPDAQFILIGSSMGGLIATLLGGASSQISAMILLAPGFGLSRRWREMLSVEEFDGWRRAGSIDVLHHAAQTKLPLRYAFIEDAEVYTTEDLTVSVPTLALHGIADTIVPIHESERLKENNPELVELHRIQSDHALTDCMDELWSLMSQFLRRHQLSP